MSKNPYQVIEKPIITEKGMDVKERARTLCFRVDRHATKTEIKAAVQAILYPALVKPGQDGVG